MISTDEDALVCDFAEYYHIYNFRGLPVDYAATLACGLREDSRIFVALNGTKHGFSMMFEAVVIDYLARLWWAQTKDGQEGRNAPESLYAKLFGDNEAKYETFVSGSDFMKRWNELSKENNEA